MSVCYRKPTFSSEDATGQDVTPSFHRQSDIDRCCCCHLLWFYSVHSATFTSSPSIGQATCSYLKYTPGSSSGLTTGEKRYIPQCCPMCSPQKSRCMQKKFFTCHCCLSCHHFCHLPHPKLQMNMPSTLSILLKIGNRFLDDRPKKQKMCTYTTCV